MWNEGVEIAKTAYVLDDAIERGDTGRIIELAELLSNQVRNEVSCQAELGGWYEEYDRLTSGLGGEMHDEEQSAKAERACRDWLKSELAKPGADAPHRYLFTVGGGAESISEGDAKSMFADQFLTYSNIFGDVSDPQKLRMAIESAYESWVDEHIGDGVFSEPPAESLAMTDLLHHAYAASAAVDAAIEGRAMATEKDEGLFNGAILTRETLRYEELMSELDRRECSIATPLGTLSAEIVDKDSSKYRGIQVTLNRGDDLSGLVSWTETSLESDGRWGLHTFAYDGNDEEPVRVDCDPDGAWVNPSSEKVAERAEEGRNPPCLRFEGARASRACNALTDTTLHPIRNPQR